MNIRDSVLKNRRPVRLEGTSPPRLIVVVDTEEERSWNGTYPRDATSVSAIREIELAQRIFDGFGIRPTYVIDYPVASQPDGYLPLRDVFKAGKCLIGAHLHPWVNPPFVERSNRRNTFPGNLNRDVELAKLRVLAGKIEENFGVRPGVYKAGRYGIGLSTPSILEELGFAVDLSVCPCFDYGMEGGPDFTKETSHLFWLGPSGRVLEIPLSCGFVGSLRRWPKLYELGRWRWPKRARLPAIFSRLHLIDRLRLSPENFSTPEHRRLTRQLLNDGVQVITLSFHSPSLKPGCTPYVRTKQELSAFLDSIRRYLDFFLGDLGGIGTDPVNIRTMAQASNGNGASKPS